MNKIRIIFIILAMSTIIFLIVQKLIFINVIVKFDSLEPFDKKMNVYFKGFKIGQTTKIYPDKTYQNTYLKLKLYRSKIKLPLNSTAKIKKVSSGNYVEILYPDSPSLKMLKNNNEIKGCIAKDINSILEDKLTDEDIDVIVGDATSLINNANNTIKSLNDVFSSLNSILQDVRPDIKKASLNLAMTTENLKNSSDKLNNMVQSDGTDISFSNIVQTTENIKQITANLDNITTQIDDVTVPLTNDVLCETKSTMANINEISSGINATLQKHFGLWHLFFGKPNGNK